jgi:hypothetical protein
MQGKSHDLVFYTLLRVLTKRGHQVDVIKHFSLEILSINYRIDLIFANKIFNIKNN